MQETIYRESYAGTIFSRHKERIFIAVLCMQALFISFCNTTHPFSEKRYHPDSAVFMYIGKMMHEGIMPYVDVFDHKGPLLYVINWLGMFIGPVGVWLIELFCLIISIILCYKSAVRFFSSSASFFGTVAAFIALLSWYNMGNFAHTYMLPFSFGALYCLTSYFTQDFELKRNQCAIAGACMGAVLMLLPNMIGLWIGMCGVILVHTLIIRKYRLVYRYALFFAIGTVASMLPFIFWLAINDALSAFYYCYIEFNFRYTDYYGAPLSGVYENILYSMEMPAILLVAAILFISVTRRPAQRDNRCIMFLSLLAAFIINIVLVAVSGSSPHYYLVFVPCLALPITAMVKCGIQRFNLRPISIILLIGIILHSSLMQGGSDFLYTFLREDKLSSTLVPIMEEKTNTNEPISIIGNTTVLHLKANRPAASYYLYTYPVFVVDKSAVDVYIADLETNKPPLIIHNTTTAAPDTLMQYLNINYSVIYEFQNVGFDPYIVYEIQK